jgi:hypothetical protein
MCLLMEGLSSTYEVFLASLLSKKDQTWIWLTSDSKYWFIENIRGKGTSGHHREEASENRLWKIE